MRGQIKRVLIFINDNLDILLIICLVLLLLKGHRII
jgi:hypothetical protein